MPGYGSTERDDGTVPDVVEHGAYARKEEDANAIVAQAKPF